MLLIAIVSIAIAYAADSATVEVPAIVNLEVQARLDYQRQYVDRELVGSNTGFKGKYVNILLSGNITDKFSYSYRQRLIKPQHDASFWDATDWLWLNYNINSHWSVNAGKQVVMIGGFEYDRAPIDMMISSEFWNNIPCYQMGVYLGYTPNEGKDFLLAQFCQSPFRYVASDMYSYNFMWSGTRGFYKSIWSFNVVECSPGKYITYLSLGNQFTAGPVTFQLDYMNRASKNHSYFFKDFSVMGEISYMPSIHFNIFAKATYDVNNSGTPDDLLVVDGTELTTVGGGLEYFPLKKKSVRVHAAYSYTFGNQANPDGVMFGKQQFMDIGLTWKIDLLHLRLKKPLKF